jgi:hypothetical protein
MTETALRKANDSESAYACFSDKQGQARLVAQISDVTIWRWLSVDALQPWRHCSWIFPRDPHFAEKAGRAGFQ